ncbi:hypothetical protein GW17_00048218 [Ensete ventricosum]|nr:hypothetical protein GW17_00048218 [Ensete ventricosum]
MFHVARRSPPSANPHSPQPTRLHTSPLLSSPSEYKVFLPCSTSFEHHTLLVIFQPSSREEMVGSRRDPDLRLRLGINGGGGDGGRCSTEFSPSSISTSIRSSQGSDRCSGSFRSATPERTPSPLTVTHRNSSSLANPRPQRVVEIAQHIRASELSYWITWSCKAAMCSTGSEPTAGFRPCAQSRLRWSGIGWEARERSTGPARERASAGSARECTSGSSISGSTEGSCMKTSSGWGQPIWPLRRLILEEEEEGKEMMDISCDLDLRLRLSSRGSDVCPTDSGPVGSNGYSSLVVVKETSRIAYLSCGMLYPGRWSSRASRRRTSSNRSPYSTMVGSVSAMSRTSRAIISMAKRQMDPPPSPHPHPPEQLLINPGLAMKRSLRLFLQKRKSRSHSLSPYAPCPL